MMQERRFFTYRHQSFIFSPAFYHVLYFSWFSCICRSHIVDHADWWTSRGGGDNAVCPGLNPHATDWFFCSALTSGWLQSWNRVSAGHGLVCQTRCLSRFRGLTCAFIMALFLQSNTISACLLTGAGGSGNRGIGFGSVPVTALLVYLPVFQLVTVIFTYVLVILVTSWRFWIWRHLGYWPGRVGSGHRVKSHRVGWGHGSKILTRFHLWLTHTEQEGGYKTQTKNMRGMNEKLQLLWTMIIMFGWVNCVYRPKQSVK